MDDVKEIKPLSNRNHSSETLKQIYEEYFSERNKENIFITASLGTGKNYSLNQVLSNYDQKDDELIIYSAPTLLLKDTFVEAHNAYNLDFIDPEKFKEVLKRCNNIESFAFSYIHDHKLARKHDHVKLMSQSKIACTHTSLLKGQMSNFLRTRQYALTNKSLITIIVDESFLDHMIQTCTLSLNEARVFDLNPYTLESFDTGKFEGVKRSLYTKSYDLLTDVDKELIDIINRVDTIKNMTEREVSEDICDEDIIYSYTGRLNLSYLDQPNIRFLVLDACGDINILHNLLGIKFDSEKSFKPVVNPEKVKMWHYNSSIASRANKSSSDTLANRAVDYQRLKYICDDLFGRQPLELSGLTHFDLAKVLRLKGHYRNSAGKNYWENNKYLIIYGMYFHHKGDLDIKVSHFINMRTEDFCEHFTFDWSSMHYKLRKSNKSASLKDKLVLANKLVDYIYESVITQSIGRIRFHRHLFNQEAKPIHIVLACPDWQLNTIKKYLPPELRCLMIKGLENYENY